MDDYSKYPKSISELKADKSQNGADWTPRDVLIEALRQIDSKEINPTTLIICIGQINIDKPDEIKTWFSQSSPNSLISIGVLTRVLYRFNLLMDN